MSKYIPNLIEEIRKGADIAIASRFFTKGGKTQGVTWMRSVLSGGVNFLLKTIFPIAGVSDYTGGFRAYGFKILKKGFSRYGENKTLLKRRVLHVWPRYY